MISIASKNRGKFFAEVVRRYGEDRVAERAAALSFYTLVALVPLIVAILFVGELIIGSSSLERTITLFFADTLGDEVAGFFSLLFDNVSAIRGQLLASVVGIVVIVYGFSNLTYHLRAALMAVFDFDIVSESAESGDTMVESAVRDRSVSVFWVSFFALVFLALLLLQFFLSVLLSMLATALYFISSQLLFSIAQYTVTLLVLMLFLLSVYRVSSRGTISYLRAFRGAAFGALLIVLLNELFAFFLTGMGALSAFGISASLVVFILWVHYIIQAVLVGGIVARTLKR